VVFHFDLLFYFSWVASYRVSKSLRRRAVILLSSPELRAPNKLPRKQLEYQTPSPVTLL
jgi:hypothetical protein